MGKIERHIQEKLEVWTAAGLISPAQAHAIRARESDAKPRLPWGMVIFSGFGAVVLGLGVTLLFAYNWDQMHKFTKLAVVLGALAAAHGTGLHLRRRAAPQGVAEAAWLLGTMLFGAGIWLVAQIYHISAHYPDAFFVWAAGALLLAWALPSVAQGLLATVLLAVWACAEAGSFDHHLAVAPLWLVLGTGWLAWRLRSPVLLAASAVSLAVASATGLSDTGSGAFLVLLGVSTLYGSLAWLARGQHDFPAAQAILSVSAMVLYFPLLFILTFHNAAKDLLARHPWSEMALPLEQWLPVIVLPIMALALSGIATRRAAVHRQCNTPEFRGHLAAPAVILCAFLISWALLQMHPAQNSQIAGLSIATLASAVFLYHTVASLWLGCRGARLGSVVGGSLLMAAWVFARYVDLCDSLLARGVMFLVMGAALFAVALLYHRQKRHVRIPHAPSPGAAATGTPD